MDKAIPEYVRTRPRAFSGMVVEILGSLLPGLAFVLSCALVWEPHSPAIQIALGEIPSLEGVGGFAIVILVLMMSYIPGQILFGQGPNIPDKVSVLLNLWSIVQGQGACRQDGRQRAGGGWLRMPLAKVDVQFPYRYLREYLEYRGLAKLAKLVPWKGTDPSTHHLRSKQFINTHKKLIQLTFPQHYFSIEKNEAKIRMISGVWYVSAINILMLPVAWATLPTGEPTADSGAELYWIIGALSAFVFVGSAKVLHYMRLREIIDVLEVLRWSMEGSRQDRGVQEDQAS